MQYVNFEKSHGNLLITWAEGVTDEDKRELRDIAENQGYFWAELEAAEYELCNGWEWLRPEELGWLVSDTAPIYSDDVERDEDGKLVSVGRVYFQTDYAIRSWLDGLFDGSTVVLHGFE